MLAEAARDVKFPARYRLFEDGGNATRFWLIQSGHVTLDLHVPGEGPVVIETIGMGELLGWSWMLTPYTWTFGAVTATAVEAFEFDAAAVREYCAADPELGYEFNQRIIRVLAQRLLCPGMSLPPRSWMRPRATGTARTSPRCGKERARQASRSRSGRTRAAPGWPGPFRLGPADSWSADAEPARGGTPATTLNATDQGPPTPRLTALTARPAAPPGWNWSPGHHPESCSASGQGSSGDEDHR